VSTTRAIWCSRHCGAAADSARLRAMTLPAIAPSMNAGEPIATTDWCWTFMP